MSHVLKDEHGRHREEGNSGQREEHVDSEVQVQAECPGHYKREVVTGQREGAGGINRSPSQHAWESPSAV